MKAFVQNINIDSHQTSPGYVLTFIRYTNRDTTNYTGVTQLDTRKPFVVVNDAVSVDVNYSKSNPVPTMSCSLRQGDINYLTAVSPGDYVIVNMVNWETKAMEIRQRALARSPINRSGDGFKGLFKILDVNMQLSIDGNGTKNYYVNVTARGFDEFNNILYFNPALSGLTGYSFLNNFAPWQSTVQTKGVDNVEKLVKQVIKTSIGEGFKGNVKGTTPPTGQSGDRLNQVPAYKIPADVASLLGVEANTIADINKYYIGMWPRVGSSYSEFFKQDEKNFYNTGIPLAGTKKVDFQDFQSVKVWSLLQDFSNHQLNESYTCYRKAPNGSVYPSVVIRQKPFSTNHFDRFCSDQGLGKSVNHTPFLSLPRWKISPDIITGLNIGRSDHGRINFVMVFSRTNTVDAQINEATQMLNNYFEDEKDVERNGRKPYIVNCYFDYPGVTPEVRTREWTLLMADWVLNGHLKMNGTIESVGIEEPICVGDNLELDNVVYHIESISHSVGISSEGYKYFRTNLTLSYGIDLRSESNSQTPVYAEMDNTDSYQRRINDFNNEKILPGFSDSQDWPGRSDAEEVKETKQTSFTNPKPVRDPEID